MFAVTIIAPGDLLAISNGPEVDREVRPDGRHAVRFAETMPMSTYLVAFITGPLVATPPRDVSHVPMRMVHVPGKDHLTGFGLEVGAFALQWFQDYYGLPYPSDKVDLVAADFAAGAMENLGCITFRERVARRSRSATQGEELVADVVAHELAHMWFGDLVTMRWWNGIWLTRRSRPSWRWRRATPSARLEAVETFGLERTAAFETDSLASTRTGRVRGRIARGRRRHVRRPHVREGRALLRMLEQYLGEERFGTASATTWPSTATATPRRPTCGRPRGDVG